MYVFKCAPKTLDDSPNLLYTYEITANKYCTICTNNSVEKPGSSNFFFFANIWTGQEDKEEDVGSYWMTLRKGQDTLI